LEDADVTVSVDPMLGRVLDGRYRIDARIARGGMATVYEAHDVRLNRVCAVKVMHTDLGDDHDFEARFVREAHSAARLSHPNVVSVTDQGDDHGRLFIVMEYVPGRTLRDVIREEAPMAPTRALALLEPVLLALAEAHRSGIVHRDIKPENVLIADDGRIKVADFGLARAFDANTTHTATGGLLIGTVSYLAPELIVNGKADPRSDVYAAGVLLYEMLTGRKPHEGEGAIQIAFKHVNEDVPRPSESADITLPPYVDALVLRATAREREHRPADAKVFLQQLRRVRGALDAGETDDAELTADLLPLLPAVAHGIDYTDETLADTPAVEPDREPTTIIGPVVQPGIDPPADARRTMAADPVMPLPRKAPVAGPRPPAGATPARPAKRRSRRGPLLLLLVVLLTILVAYAGWWFGIGRYTATPGVLNMSVPLATDKVETAGLELDVVDKEYSETVTAGSVISTDPEPGSKIVEGGTVEAVVSLGPERYEVPKLGGTPYSEAEALLEEHHLTLGVVTRKYDEEVPKGIIIAADPGVGTELQKDRPVNLIVSKGPEPIKIPDFTGKDADRAQQELTDLGFEVEVTEENSDEVEDGDVISQDPDRGKGFRDDTIALVVSKGPVLVEVPNVRTMSVEEATAALEGVGLKIAVVETEFYVGLNRVVRQSVDDGDAIPKGDTVTVYIV
jgi:serine/threonine-protein kinase